MLFSTHMAHGLLRGCAGLLVLLAGQVALADSLRLQELAPVQVFQAPQIQSAQPMPLPDDMDASVGLDPSSVFGNDADSIPDISYGFSWSDNDSALWRASEVSPTSPGLWGAVSTPYGQRFSVAPAQSAVPWSLGANNWSMQDDQGLSLALGNSTIAAPAWGSSARLGGIRVAQSSLSHSDDQQADWHYALSVGALDNAVGSGGDLVLGPTAASSVVSYGVGSGLMLESQLQFAPDLMSSGLGGRYKTGWSDVSVGMTQASVGDQSGRRYQASYTVDVLEDLQLSWLGERREAGYGDLGNYSSGPLAGRRLQQWSATVPLGRWGDITGQYQSERTALGDSQRSFGFTQQFWYSPNLQVGLEANRQLDGEDYDIGIRLSVPVF